MTKTFAKVLEKMQSSTYAILSYDDKTNGGSMSSCAKVTERINCNHLSFCHIKISVNCRE